MYRPAPLSNIRGFPIAMRKPMLNVLKPWLAEFLSIRGQLNGPPDGKPLYSYQVSKEEFDSLKTLLKEHSGLSEHPDYMGSWAAGYCLFVAEQFRRYYDAGPGGWSWRLFDLELDCEFTPQQKSNIVEKGLVNFWKRDIRTTEHGRDFIGTLFAEGGLPWLLVQSDEHGFGRAVRRGLRHIYSEQSAQKTVVELLADHEGELPQAFQTLHTRQLLAGIVQQLFELVNDHDLHKRDDATDYLDQNAPSWRDAFLVPLDDVNAGTLISEWLLLAKGQKKIKSQQNERARWFTCEHFIEGAGEDWKLRADILLPDEYSFKLDNTDLSSTRLQVVLYEGDQLLARGAYVYAQLENQAITIRFPQTKVPVIRRDLESQIVLKFLANGQEIVSHTIGESELDLQRAPLVFTEKDDEYNLASNASCVLHQTRAQIRLPAGAEVENVESNLLFQETSGARWVEVEKDTQLKINSELYVIAFGGSSEAGNKPYINGVIQGQLLTNPKTVFYGWPSLEIPVNYAFKGDIVQQFVNGAELSSTDTKNLIGVVDFVARGEGGAVLIRRKFGVLPADFSLIVVPGYNDSPAHVILKSQIPLKAEVVNTEIRSEKVPHPDGQQIDLHLSSSTIPGTLILNIQGDNSRLPITIRLPYPNLSASLVDESDKPFSSRELSLDDLLGKRIILASGKSGKQRFNIRLKLMGSVSPQPVTDFYVTIGRMPIELNLYNYQNDIEQMLASTDDQDAFVHVAVSSVSQLLDFNIRRYSGSMERSSRARFTIHRHSALESSGQIVAEAMLLSDPRQSPLVLPALKSEGVTTGGFEVMPEMEKSSPWLIYPSKQSAVQFRPELFIGSEANVNDFNKIVSLHQACQAYHPTFQPDAINDQIKLMANDLGHSGWQYLSDLKHKYSHLPLSSFETWKSLTKNTETLAIAIFRLELDEIFCNRIRDELSIFWECIHLDTWRSGYLHFERWLIVQGLSESLVKDVVASRMTLLSKVVPGFKEFSGYIKTGDVAELPPIPLDIVVDELKKGYQTLRRNHESNDHWPTSLSTELVSWINESTLPKEIKTLSLISYSHSVTYVPIYMAHVTVGQNVLTDLHSSTPYLKHAVRQLSEFDRVGWYNFANGMMVNYLMRHAAQTDNT